MTTIEVRDVPDEQRYEARIDGDLAAFLEYRLAGTQIVLIHTEVDPAFGGRGVGSAIARGALDDVRARGLRVVAECTFVAGWIAKHDDYADLVDGAVDDEAVTTAP